MVKVTGKKRSLYNSSLVTLLTKKVSKLNSSFKSEKYNKQGGSSMDKINEIIKKIRKKESVIEVKNGEKLAINNSRLSSRGNTTNERHSNFKGLNIGILAKEAANIDIKNSMISTTGKGMNAAFSYGEGTFIDIDNVIIKTKGNFSNGLSAGLMGTIHAHDISINTEGDNSAAISVYYENGIIDASNVTGLCDGNNSPCIYSKGNIVIKDSSFKTEKAPGAIVDGSSLVINNTTINSKESYGIVLLEKNGKDRKMGKCVFTSNLGSITAGKGALFYVTNTEAIVTLFNTKLITSNTSNILVNACKGSWEGEGSNGGKLNLIGDHQTLKGDILCDELSSVNLNLKNYTYFTGIINERKKGAVSINLDSTSVWTLKGNSYIDYLIDENKELKNIVDNGYTIYYNSKNEKNNWLESREHSLSGGGKLIPV